MTSPRLWRSGSKHFSDPSHAGPAPDPRDRAGSRVKIADAGEFPRYRKNHMDVEHINAIGNALADLTQRTAALRG